MRNKLTIELKKCLLAKTECEVQLRKEVHERRGREATSFDTTESAADLWQTVRSMQIEHELTLCDLRAERQIELHQICAEKSGKKVAYENSRRVKEVLAAT